MCIQLNNPLVNPNILYAGAATAGAWKTTDKGNNWNLITKELLFLEYMQLK